MVIFSLWEKPTTNIWNFSSPSLNSEISLISPVNVGGNGLSIEFSASGLSEQRADKRCINSEDDEMTGDLRMNFYVVTEVSFPKRAMHVMSK